jgi:hypothetical protein
MTDSHYQLFRTYKEQPHIYWYVLQSCNISARKKAHCACFGPLRGKRLRDLPLTRKRIKDAIET